MVWTCRACTFDNPKDDALECSVCRTSRNNGASKNGGSADGPYAVVQVEAKKQSVSATGNSEAGRRAQLRQKTLFGTFLCNDKGTKKRKRETAAAVTTIATTTRENPASSNQARNKKSPPPSQPPQKSQSAKARTSHGEPFGSLWNRSRELMSSVFGIHSLRNLQPDAIKCALRGESQIIILATGGGKSLCYQLPAVTLGGTTIVVSPLIALMVDQVSGLRSRGVSAEVISSSEGERKNKAVIERLLRQPSEKKDESNRPTLPPITLLYCTPELLSTDRFRKVLIKMNKASHLALIAIDEAHCLSSWGHDFRPAYRKLDWLRDSFPKIPLMACTATATPKVLKDIRDVLHLPEDTVPCHMSSFNRPNITYRVRYRDALDAVNPDGSLVDMTNFIKTEHKNAEESSRACSGIIYVHKRQDTVDVANQITSTVGIPTASYHAGLRDAERTQVQKDWTEGRVKIVVATVAFGMGIDLGHVRYVIHWTIPKTVEGFYQESGRAGRDGKAALSLLYFSQSDVDRFAFVIRKSKKDPERSLQALQKMSEYCTNPQCRRQFLLSHFGENSKPDVVCKKTCDYCVDPKKVVTSIQSAKAMKDVMKTAFSFKGKSDEASKAHWKNPLQDDEEEDVGLAWTQNDLGITHAPEVELLDADDVCKRSKEVGPKTGFVKASSILAKYEKLENSRGPTIGSSKTEDDTTKVSRPAVIPEHLRKGLPDPFAAETKKQKSASESKSSVQLANETARLQAELSALKDSRQARLAALRAKMAKRRKGGP